MTRQKHRNGEVRNANGAATPKRTRSVSGSYYTYPYYIGMRGKMI